MHLEHIELPVVTLHKAALRPSRLFLITAVTIRIRWRLSETLWMFGQRPSRGVDLVWPKKTEVIFTPFVPAFAGVPFVSD